MPVRECAKMLTYREFLEWQAYFDTKWKVPTANSFYLAQICQYIEAVNSTNGKSKPLNNHLLSFHRNDESEDEDIRFKRQRRKDIQLQKDKKLKKRT